jgi:hypothetical protein
LSKIGETCLRRRKRRKKGAGPINKAEIEVIPSTELIDCNKYFDVVVTRSVENIYEELPSTAAEDVEDHEPVMGNNNYPDVKISVL